MKMSNSWDETVNITRRCKFFGQCVMKGANEEDFAVELAVPDKVISYNLKCNTLKMRCDDFAQGLGRGRPPLRFLWWNRYTVYRPPKLPIKKKFTLYIFSIYNKIDIYSPKILFYKFKYKWFCIARLV